MNFSFYIHAVGSLSYLNKYFWKYRWRLMLGILFMTFSAWFSVKIPDAIRLELDRVKPVIEATHASQSQLFTDELRNTLLWFLVSVFLFAILQAVFLFFTRQTLIVMSRLIEFDLKNELYAHYQRLSQSFYRRNNTGDLMTRITQDVEKVRQYIGPALMYGINLLATIVFVIMKMLPLSPKLTFYVLVPLPLLSVSIYVVNRLIQKRSTAVQEKLSQLQSSAQEVFSGIRVVKSYVQEKNMARLFEAENEDYRKLSMKLAGVDAFWGPLMVVMIGFSSLMTIYMGGREAIEGNSQITVGLLAQFVIYIGMLTWPITALGWNVSMIQAAAASQTRINEFLLQKPDIESDHGEKRKLNGQIEFKDVGFVYPDSGIRALQNVSFKIEKGERWAIIGRTGSGKSTIAELLMRLYDPQEGEILLDGLPLRNLHAGFVRQQIGYVPQDVFLFSETIENNVLFGKSEENALDALEASRYAGIRSEIEEFPDRFQTMVGERGVTLSGGQKQRISLARALSKNPGIVLLDDCLSAVDASTEKHIIENLNQFLYGKTCVIITHRIFALFDFDRILVLDHGQLVESGTHAELIARNGHYARLYLEQLKDEAKMRQ